MDIQKITTPYTTTGDVPPIKHHPWFIGFLAVGSFILVVMGGIYVYRQYNTPEQMINRALEEVSKTEALPITQEDIEREMGRVSKTKPIVVDQKTIEEAMNQTQK